MKIEFTVRNIIFLSFLLLTACACSKSPKEELLLLRSTPIQLPKNSIITYLGKDTLATDYFRSKYKVVIYTDSTSCSSCALNKLYLWEDLIEWSDKSGDSVKYYFVFNPPMNDNIRIALRNSMLDYPMLLDSLGEFERLNPHLPKNKAMHTFLLDENNNVVLVGNPLLNPKIEKMFKEIIEEKLSKKE